MWWALYVTPPSRGGVEGGGHCKSQATQDYTARPGLQIKKKREKEVRTISGNLSGTPTFGGVRFRGERELQGG